MSRGRPARRLLQEAVEVMIVTGLARRWKEDRADPINELDVGGEGKGGLSNDV